MPAVGQEQQQVQRQPDGGGRTCEQSRADQQSNRNLHQRDPHPRQRRVRDRERAQQEPSGGGVGKAAQLGADVGRRAGMQEAGIAELLNPAIDEGNAQEQPERHERPPQPPGVQFSAPSVAQPTVGYRLRAIGAAALFRSHEPRSVGRWAIKTQRAGRS